MLSGGQAAVRRKNNAFLQTAIRGIYRGGIPVIRRLQNAGKADGSGIRFAKCAFSLFRFFFDCKKRNHIIQFAGNVFESLRRV